MGGGSDPSGVAGRRRRDVMPRYLSLFTYTPEALDRLIKEPQDRSAVLREYAKARGGKLLAFYHMGDGDYHGMSITEEPSDNDLRPAPVWATQAAGHLESIRVMELYTPEETMEAIRKMGELASGFPRPGGPSGGGSS
jgi:uncharacterized protein with GYD domain